MYLVNDISASVSIASAETAFDSFKVTISVAVPETIFPAFPPVAEIEVTVGEDCPENLG